MIVLKKNMLIHKSNCYHSYKGLGQSNNARSYKTIDYWTIEPNSNCLFRLPTSGFKLLKPTAV